MSAHFLAARSCTLLGVMAGRHDVTGVPVGILTFRDTESLNTHSVMLERPSLERMVEDLKFLLESSPALSKGKHNSVSLAEVESINLGE